MARVLALVPDLLFGSRVQAALLGAGHDVELVNDTQRVREQFEDPAQTDVLIVDLTSDEPDGVVLVRSLADEGKLTRARTLGFFSHVDTDTRERAQQAGFDLVVPRSRMAREGAELVTRLAEQAGPAQR
jgi:DNA-binding NarL/FixJ family response regulator